MFNVSLYEPANLPLQAGPSPLIPTAPDFGLCDRRYGAHLSPLLCGWAADTLIYGDSLVPYTVRSGNPGDPQTLPYTTVLGNCRIWIEIAGPATPGIYEAVPNEIRGMAGWVINECVGGSGKGYGGFVIKDISKLTAYVTEPDTKIGGTYPTSSAFLTVTVTGFWDSVWPPSPGNYDPSIAQHLAEVELDAWTEAAPGSPLRQDLASREQFFTRQSMRMQTGGSTITWWGSNPRIATSKT